MKILRDVVILIADGVPDKSGDFFDKTSVITCDHSDVPLTDASGYAIGIAIPLLNINGKKAELLADLKFYNGIPPEMYGFQPCFIGKCINRMVCHVLEAKLTSVMVCSSNADSRVPTLGSYMGIATELPKTKYDVCMCERLLNGHEPNCGWVRNKNGPN